LSLGAGTIVLVIIN